MLLALLSPLIGIFGSMLPSIIRIFEKKQDFAHELALIDLKTKGAIEAAKYQLDVENVKADVAEGESLRNHDKSIDGGVFINALRGSIRPVITYLFFALFVGVKIASAYTMIHNGQSVPQMLDAVWDAETMALFSTILAFWFGSRVLEKQEERIGRSNVKVSKIKVTA